MAQGKAEDAGGLTPVKDGNAALRLLVPRTFARYFDAYYRKAAKLLFYGGTRRNR